MNDGPNLATILVVDDNEANRSLAQHTLVDEGFTVVLASGGVEGLAAFEREHPDCVLLDVRMPDLDGFAVCQRIRALPAGADTPVLFFTALRDIDTFDRALDAGGDDFLSKPVRPTELVVRVKAALELRRLGAELREHYALLKKQRDDLQRLQLQKERLTAFIVHDLKNPVNAMDLNAQVLLRNKDVPESARESVTQIRAAARKLTRMIVNLLDVSKADEGLLVPKRKNVAIGPLIADAVAELRPAADARGVTLAATVEVEHASLDDDLIRRVLVNLTENAVRYAPSASTVTLTARRGDAGTELRITDHGVGIPLGMRDKIFEPFVQVDAASGPPSGNRGLGLSFCKLAVEAHGGSISVVDEAPGNTFLVVVPDPSG